MLCELPGTGASEHKRNYGLVLLGEIALASVKQHGFQGGLISNYGGQVDECGDWQKARMNELHSYLRLSHNLHLDSLILGFFFFTLCQ